MKKLMIAMTTIASLALVAKAEALGGSDFNTMTTGAFDVNVAESSPKYGSNSYWSRTADGESAVIEETENKYLKVDESGVLARSIAGNSATQAIPDGGSVDIDARVQFTMTQVDVDSEGNPAKISLAEGSKIAVWAKQTGESDETGVIVVSAADENADQKDYVTTTEVAKDTWYSLKVLSKIEDEIMKFTVSINDEVIGTYDSLVQTGDKKATIASVGFKGTGAVDDIVFTAVEGEVAVPVTLSAACNDDEIEVSFEVDGEGVEEANVGDTVTIIVPAEKGATVTGDGLEFAWSDDYEAYIATYELVAEDAPSKEFAITVTEGEGGDLPTYIDPANTEMVEKYTTWAEKYGKDTTSVNGEAFALNCAPDAVDTAKANFTVTITMEDGKPVVTAPGEYNVTPEIIGSKTVDGEYTPGIEEKNFFKARILIVK